MTDEEYKTFKILCVNRECCQPFHVRFRLARPGSDDPANIIVECPYCGHKNLVTIPSAYVEQEHLMRGLKGRSRGEKGCT